MKQSNLENLEYLLSTYFYQCWRDEFSDFNSAIDAFIQVESAVMIKSVIDDICELQELDLPEHDIQSLLPKMGSYYSPWLIREKTSVEFLNELRLKLVEAVYH